MDASYQFAIDPETKRSVFLMIFGDDMFVAYDCQSPFDVPPYERAELPSKVEKKSFCKTCNELRIGEPKTYMLAAFELLRQHIKISSSDLPSR